MRPSFKRLFAVNLLIIFQVGRYSNYFSLIYLKDIKSFFKKMSEIIIKIFLQNVVKKSFFLFSGWNFESLSCDSKQTLFSGWPELKSSN